MSVVGVRWALAAAAAVLWVSGAAADSWSSIGDNLRAGMAGVLEMAAVNYSEPNINVTYTARLEFDMRAMGALYNATPAVLDAIFHEQAYPEGIVTVSDGHLEIYSPLMDKWRPLAAHYAGPITALTCAALLAVALPTAGLFWCCCYWCRGGQRRRPFDRKYDACLKGVLAILLIALLTLFLFGVVCAFASDSQVEEGLQAAPAAVRGGARDVRAFLGATAAHARHLLVTNYQELERKLHSILDSSGLTISVQLGEFTRAVSVTTLASMVRELDVVQADLRQVTRATAALRLQAERLNAALRSVKGQLLRTLAQCEQPQCRQLQEKHRIGQLDTEIQYSQMPDVTELLNNVTELLESDIKKEVEEGSKVFREIQREVQRSVDEHLPSVNMEITKIGVRLSAMADEITWQAGNASEAVQRGQVAVTDSMRDVLHKWGPYRRYAGLGAATALLAVVVVLAWGLTCGVCGKRPDVYGASECCNKGAGSKCLLCGTMLMFLVGGAACLVLLVYLAAGGVLQRAACDPLTEPDGNRLFYDLERVVDLERWLFNERRDPDFNMTYVLHHCHRNQTVYRVFQLHRLYDLQMIKDELSSAVEKRVASLRPQFSRQRVQILAPSAKVKLRRLADTGLSEFDFDRILYALETNMTSLALDALSSQLESAATALAERPGFRDVALQLRQAADKLQRTDADIVRPMLQHTHQLNETAMRLRDVMRFNHSSLKEAVSYLMHETTQAEVFLNTQGPALIQNMTREFAEVVAGLLEQYLARVAAAADRSVGRCGPLSAALNTTRDATCRRLLMPANGYWVSLAWCVALLVPLMVVAQRLARLYLHLDPYPGPLVEAEYLYDAYADRDNVPLANAYKAEKRSGRRGAAGPAGGAGGPAGGAGGPAGGDARGARAADPPPAGDAHARRYTDMAPKHWEEGPPRYHGPTEYERPPPYYYPGPADRQ